MSKERSGFVFHLSFKKSEVSHHHLLLYPRRRRSTNHKRRKIRKGKKRKERGEILFLFVLFIFIY